jgi:plasmid stabilization system protein ParE
MRFWVSFRVEALHDLEAALVFFSQFAIKNDTLFKFDLEQCIEQIRDFPESHQKIYVNVRRALLSRFSYAVYYIADVKNETIEVLAILDARRDPNHWHKRI